jgi:tetratricopeptide (TPR) repeat protein
MSPIQRLGLIGLVIGTFGIITLVQFFWFRILPARLLRNQGREPGLRRQLERVLATPCLFGPSFKIGLRCDLLRLAIEEGRHQEAVDQARAILEEPVSPALECQVRSHMADALEVLGRVEEARKERRWAAVLAGPTPGDPSWYLDQGRDLEALAALERASRAESSPAEGTERLLQGLLAAAKARVLLELGRLDEASVLLGEAGDASIGDARLELWHTAFQARLLAHRKDDVALGLMDDLDRRLAEFPQDRNTQQCVLAALGRAALLLRQFERGLDDWRRYLETPANPVDQPRGLFFLGECLRGMGEIDLARSAYQSAADFNREILYARLARARLDNLIS